MPLAATNNHSGSFQLNLQPQKRNVFVTQLNEQQVDEDDDIRRFAVVKESADQLLQTGINTLQKTSLLRKAVEIEHIDEELAAKREEFHKRMTLNKSKEEALKKKQEKIKERVGKFDRFLKENEAKRTRALYKYQAEVKDNKSRARELDGLKKDLEKLRSSKEAVLKKLETHKQFEVYMMRVIDALPENYLEMSGENMIQSVIQRFEGLSATHNGLISRNSTTATELEEGQRELEAMRQERNKQKMVISHEMAELQKRQEMLTQRNQRLEQQAGDTTISHRTLISELGRITMAIDNLAEASHARHWPNLPEMSYIDKLNMINQHFHEKLRVQKLAQRMREQGYSATAAPAQPKTTHRHKKEEHDPSVPRKPPQEKRRGKLATSGFLEQLTTISERN